jgi:integrase/recombinase XerC
MDQPRDPLSEAADAFMRHMVARNAAHRTIIAYRENIQEAIAFFRRRLGPNPDLAQINSKLIRAHLVNLQDRGLAKSSVNRHFAAIRSFVRFLSERGFLDRNPVYGVHGPRQSQALPSVLTVAEVEKVIEAIDPKSDNGPRDLAMVEVMYSTGARIAELVALDLADMDLAEGIVTLKGKGRRERLGVLGAPARNAVTRYLPHRGAYTPKADGPLFVSRRGCRLSTKGTYVRMKQHMAKAGINADASPHSLRHSFATHMLDGGADLVSIKEFMGHRNLQTTTIYTHISDQGLQDAYLNAHPRAALVG